MCVCECIYNNIKVRQKKKKKRNTDQIQNQTMKNSIVVY